MWNTIRHGRAGRALLTLSVLLFTGTACQDLQVDNPVDPDRQRVLDNPADVQLLIANSFGSTLYGAMTGSNITGQALGPLAAAIWAGGGGNLTTSLASQTASQWYLDLQEPRPPINNAAFLPTTVGPHGSRTYWSMLGAPLADAHDGLRLLDAGVVITEGAAAVDVTARARAMAKFTQGLAWGYGALIFDQVNIVPESVEIPLDPTALAALSLSTLTDYPQAVEAALTALGEAIAIAQANPGVVHFPATGGATGQWLGSPTPITNAQFIQIINTLRARLLVLNARNPTERAAVDWSRVLSYTAAGIQNSANDLVIQLEQSRQNLMYQRIQGMGGVVALGGFRWDHRTIGMADQSGNYQTWIAAPTENRVRFNITTPDRRITGPTPNTDGSYTRYRCCTTADDAGLEAARGSYFMGNYQWARHAIRNNLTRTATTTTLTGWNSGTQPLVTADENALLRAEAILRTTGVTQEALDLINRTRTRQQTTQPGTGQAQAGTTFPGLPPLLLANQGAPVGADCVPRRDNGTCGTVNTALRYERMVELAVYDLLYGYADGRGFGMLPEGAPEHWPVPGNVLDLYGLTPYTFGGPGEPNTLTYAPWN
jgi:hypothetical protein